MLACMMPSTWCRAFLFRDSEVVIWFDLSETGSQASVVVIDIHVIIQGRLCVAVVNGDE